MLRFSRVQNKIRKAMIQYALITAMILSPVAQWKERLPSKQRVEGSSPSGATTWEKYIATGYSHGCTLPRSGKEFKKPRKGANGKWPVPNETVAADPSIPFGTKLLISYRGKIFRMVVGDRGHAITGKRLDLFFEDCEKAKAWGKRKVDVKILND